MARHLSIKPETPDAMHLPGIKFPAWPCSIFPSYFAEFTENFVSRLRDKVTGCRFHALARPVEFSPAPRRVSVA